MPVVLPLEEAEVPGPVADLAPDPMAGLLMDTVVGLRCADPHGA